MKSTPGPGSARRASRAFLLRQKSTGEEVVVMMTPIKSAGVGANTVVSRIPAYVATSGKITTPPRKKTRWAANHLSVLSEPWC
jgi:hypothetical protein